MKNKTYCVNKINACKVTHVYLSVWGEMGHSMYLDTGVLLLHQWSTLKKIKKIKSGYKVFIQNITVCTIPNTTQQHKAELHLYVSDTSYQEHKNIFFHLQRLSPFCSL